jgi:hypothetical protein
MVPMVPNYGLDNGVDANGDDECTEEPPKGRTAVSVGLHLDAYSERDRLVVWGRPRVGLVLGEASAGRDVHEERLGRCLGHRR